MNSHGQSLIQVLVAIGLMAIVTLGFTTMMTNQHREIRALNEVLASMDLHKTVIASLAKGSVCQYILNTPNVLTFDANAVTPDTPQILTPTLPLYSSVSLGPPVSTGPVTAKIGEVVSPFSNSLIVDSIVLSISGAPSPLPAPGPGAYFTGTWIISFDSTKTIRQVKPISVSTILTVDTSTPTAAKITECMLSDSGVGTSCTTVQATTGASNVTATCPAGYRIFSGGCSGFIPAANSVPVPNGWYCSNTTQPQGGTAYAYCCK